MAIGVRSRKSRVRITRSPQKYIARLRHDSPSVLAACLLSGVSDAFAIAPSKPNFIIIMVDDMGYAGVSCFGNP